jgi:uncharacterized membrane protein
MRDTSYIVAVIGALFLVVAGVAWWRIIRTPHEEPPTEKNIERGKSAALVIVTAFLLSAAAAVVGVVGWFQR